MNIGIGIDTGGTYTDAVAYDFESRRILASAKALTTPMDLAAGILEALDGLPAECLAAASLVSLSTTLATNAAVENKLGPARLVFLGGHAELIDRLGPGLGLPPARDMILLDCATRYSGEIDQEPDWERLRREVSARTTGMEGIAVLETYAMRNSAVLEKKAKAIAEEAAGLPVVCGHELSPGLDCLQRASGTLLNAGLFPVIRRFIDAMSAALGQRRIPAPVVIVRSDGSLMDTAYAADRPVETVLCGPAASVMGCVALTDEKDCLIVDMGGTTTDIALIRDGVPVRSDAGIGVGAWKTFVPGLAIHTYGLGGDSAVRHGDGGPFLDRRRVIPLCMAAAENPDLPERLAAEIDPPRRHTRALHEFFVLRKDIAGLSRYTDAEKRFCDALARGPLPRRMAAEAAGTTVYELDAERLLREGVVQQGGLTPTDIMHLKGDYRRYDIAAARLGARFVAANVNMDIDELADWVYREVKRKLYLYVVNTLLENDISAHWAGGKVQALEHLILHVFDTGRSPSLDGIPVISPSFSTRFALVGMGAPIHLFLPEVASRLETRVVIPERAEVANAVGAIIGKVSATHVIHVRPIYRAEGIFGYTVSGNDQTLHFDRREEAEAFARTEAEDAARAEVLRRGASGEVAVTSRLAERHAPGRISAIFLGSAATAHAVGSIGVR